ncbi:DUF3054 domain-containing protein [Microbacterium invictum]|uniref:CHASE2 domain-containing sensor protein n=1 Tax=Microbacterium invictum TaxID=515415 RepID=A0AA40SLF7_9MICO|nr:MULTISPECIES: DUF3054 domain-containing protein [Microbacterium]MBB4138396.1 CHASE2 domain-containing sensor protein [Microbacterium invictum]
MTPRATPASLIGSFALDVVLIVAFAAAGRSSHDSDVLSGLWQTAWPFLAALAAGWIVTRAWRAPAAPIRTGVGVWAVTLVGGMLLRMASGQGTAPPFIIVAALVLGAALVGWRAIAYAAARLRRRTTVD